MLDLQIVGIGSVKEKLLLEEGSLCISLYLHVLMCIIDFFAHIAV